MHVNAPDASPLARAPEARTTRIVPVYLTISRSHHVVLAPLMPAPTVRSANSAVSAGSPVMTNEGLRPVRSLAVTGAG